MSGNMLAWLFEDLFKRFSVDLKKQINMSLGNKTRAETFDAVRLIRPDTITQGFIQTISTGNWTLKRFRMDRSGVRCFRP
jgi:DNA-directed RNA polymerase III subunit RPC2